MITFSDLTKQVHLINDLVLTDMIYETEDNLEETTSFSRHLLATKSWFYRISWANKKRFVLALLEDVRSAWTLSLLLKSMWNCRPKDAVLSVSEKTAWSCYDEVPMDHNRTALPTTLLAQVMKSDRVWFLSLEPEPQAMVLSELLIVAGGQVMWIVFRRAQTLYERYRDYQLQNLQEVTVGYEPPPEKSAAAAEKAKKETSDRKNSPGVTQAGASNVSAKENQKELQLQANLAAWDATIKSMKDSLKLEELEFTSSDGTTRRVWKVNRPKPEDKETVDFLQLLPSAIGKRILSFLPRAQLSEYSHVNKYWAFLVDELRAEQSARQKIDADLNKLRETMLRHDASLEQVEQIDVPNEIRFSSQANTSAALSLKARPPLSMKASEKSGGAYSMRHFLSDKLNKPFAAQKAIRNLAELTERLDQRGAADDNLWNWCESILKHAKLSKDAKPQHQEGALPLGIVHFPCPLMKQCLEVPLTSPLYKDPALTKPLKPRRNISEATVMQTPWQSGNKRYSLWTRDFSGLYPVLKIPSHQSPV